MLDGPGRTSNEAAAAMEDGPTREIGSCVWNAEEEEGAAAPRPKPIAAGGLGQAISMKTLDGFLMHLLWSNASSCA